MSLERRTPLPDLPSYQESLQRKIFETNQKFQDYLKDYRNKLHTDLVADTYWNKNNQNREDAQEGFRALYPGLLNHDLPDAYKILVHPEKICPVLTSYQDENKKLKEEITIVSGDLFRFMKMIECLIEENSNLVQYLDQKNRDIQKMIESSALNESEEVQDLRHTNKLLIEENQILNKHIQDDRVLEEKLQESIKDQQNIIKNSKELLEKKIQDFDAAKQREEAVSRELNLLNSKYQQLIEEKDQLEANLSQLEKDLGFNRNDRSSLQQQLYQINKDLTGTTEEKNQRIQQQANKIYELEMQLDQSNNSLKKFQKQNDQLIETRNQLWNSISQLSEINDQLKDENIHLKNSLHGEKNRLVNSVNREMDIVGQIQTLQDEVRKWKTEADESDREVHRLIDANKDDLDYQKSKFESYIKRYLKEELIFLQRIRGEYSDLIQEKDSQLDKMNEEIKEKDDKLYELDLEIQQKNAEIEELNEKLLEFDDLKKITEKQSIQIRDYLNEIQNQKALVDEQREDYDKMVGEYDERENKRKTIIKTKEDNILELNTELEAYKKGYEDYFAELQVAKKNLENTTHQLEEQRHEVKTLHDENHTLKQENTDLKQGKSKYDKGLLSENQRLRLENNEKDRELGEIQQLLDIKQSELKMLQKKSQGTMGNYEELQHLRQELKQKDIEIAALNKHIQQLQLLQHQAPPFIQPQVPQHPSYPPQQQPSYPPYQQKSVSPGQHQPQPAMTPPAQTTLKDKIRATTATKSKPQQDQKLVELEDHSFDNIPDLMMSQSSQASHPPQTYQRDPAKKPSQKKKQAYDQKSQDSFLDPRYGAPPPVPVLGKKGQSYMPDRPSSIQGSAAGQTMKQRDQLSNQAYVKTNKFK